MRVLARSVWGGVVGVGGGAARVCARKGVDVYDAFYSQQRL